MKAADMVKQVHIQHIKGTRTTISEGVRKARGVNWMICKGLGPA
jgi:hypothetical protein